MSKQITVAQWCALMERFKSIVNDGGLVTARIFNSGRSLALEGGRVCSAHVSLESDEDDDEGLRFLPRVEIVSGTALCGRVDELTAGIRFYAAVCAASSNCQGSLHGIVVVRQR
jgi:hypothetical protein